MTIQIACSQIQWFFCTLSLDFKESHLTKVNKSQIFFLIFFSLIFAVSKEREGGMTKIQTC